MMRFLLNDINDIVKSIEGLEWILGNKGMWPFTTGEQWNISTKQIYYVITRETPRNIYNSLILSLRFIFTFENTN